MTLRSDHVAGAAFIAFSIAVFAISGDLPFGCLASPGAGMMPKLATVLMVALGALLVLRAGEGKPFAEIEWSDAVHAGKLIVITGVAIGVYQRLGFLVTMTGLVSTLLVVVERKHVLAAAAYSLFLTGLAWWVFGTALKAPLETGILGF